MTMVPHIPSDDTVKQRVIERLVVEEKARISAEIFAQQQRGQAELAATVARGRAVQAQIVTTLREQAVPLYDRRAELLERAAPILAELADIEARFASLHASLESPVKDAAMAQLRHPNDIVHEARAAAGVPAGHDVMPASLPDVARWIGADLANGRIGPQKFHLAYTDRAQRSTTDK